MNQEYVKYIIPIAVLIIFSAFFSATETAFSSFNKTRVKTLAEKGNKKAKLVIKLSDDFDRLLSTILVGNNIVNILTASLGTVLFVKMLGDIGATVSTAVITVLVLLFGEITPKSCAKDSPEKFAMFAARFMNLLIFILTPLTFFFGLWKKLVSMVIKSEDKEKMSQEELIMLVDEVQEDGSINSDEGDLLKNAIGFSELRAEDILTHRIDLEAVEIGVDKAEIGRIFNETKFSRLPVYEETVDNIVGVIHQKDFYCGTGITDKSIGEIMTKPLFVLKSEKINELLQLLRENKSHVAVILDEYGGTLGIVTLEDILEELVGEIWDEHDEVIEDFVATDDGAFIVDGSLNFDDFCNFFELKIEAESISLGGWIMEILGKMPEEGDLLEYENVTVKILQTDGQRITRAEARVTPKEDTDEDED